MAVSYFHNLDVKVVMMTGDSDGAAGYVAKKTGIKKYFAGCMPEDKLSYVSNLQKKGKVVAMVGDGINDAPALTKANISVSMATGADVSKFASDLTLLHSDLSGLVKAHKLSVGMVRNMKQNLFFALVYNFLGILLATGLFYPYFGVLLSPMVAAAAMSFSSVSVVLNALRLKQLSL